MRKRSLSPSGPADWADAARRRVQAAYDTFVSTNGETADSADPKTFAAYHAAARTALGHLEQLKKLSGDDGSEAEMTDSAERLAEVRRQIAALPQEAAGDDDAG